MGAFDDTRQTRDLGPRDVPAERGETVVATTFVVAVGRALVELLDEAGFEQPGEGTVEGARMQRRVGRPRDGLQHGVTVEVATAQGQEDVEPGGGKREEPVETRAVGAHRCTSTIRVENIDEGRRERDALTVDKETTDLYPCIRIYG